MTNTILTLTKQELEATLAQVGQLETTQAQTLYAAFVAAILARCAQDGMFWLSYVVTRDEADPERVIKPFPIHLDYIRALWACLTDNQCVAIAKSRQMLVSWVVAAFCVWWARFKPHQAIFWQTQQWKDATAMVCMAEGGFLGRCQFIERHLPAWMRLSIKEQEGALTYPNGSMIQSLAGGADQVRGKVASVIVEDEFARQEEATGVWTTVAPLVQKGCKVIIVSTPNGTGNIFSTLWHGRPMEVEG